MTLKNVIDITKEEEEEEDKVNNTLPTFEPQNRTIEQFVPTKISNIFYILTICKIEYQIYYHKIKYHKNNTHISTLSFSLTLTHSTVFFLTSFILLFYFYHFIVCIQRYVKHFCNIKNKNKMRTATTTNMRSIGKTPL